VNPFNGIERVKERKPIEYLVKIGIHSMELKAGPLRIPWLWLILLGVLRIHSMELKDEPTA
jgi:hypothetical protein